MAEDPKLKIHVSAEGTDQTAASLSKVAGATKAVGKETVTAAQFTEDGLNPALAHVQQSSDKATGSFGKMRGVLQAAGREFPILGQLARFAFNPIAAGLSAGVLAAQAFRREGSELIELLKTGVGGRFARDMEAVRTALVQAKVDAASFREEIRNLAQAQQSLKERTDAAIESAKHQARASAEVSSAQKALALAQIDAAGKLGKLSPQQAIRARLNVNQVFAAQEERNKRQAETRELFARQVELQNVVGKRSEAVRALPGFEKEAQAAQQEKHRADELLSETNKAIEETKSQVKALRDEIAKITAVGPGSRSTLSLIALPQVRNQLATAEDLLDSLEGRKTALEGADFGRTQGARSSASELADARAQIRDLTIRQAQLESQLPAMMRQVGDDRSTRATVGRFERETAAFHAASLLTGADRAAIQEAGADLSKTFVSVLQSVRREIQRQIANTQNP